MPEKGVPLLGKIKEREKGWGGVDPTSCQVGARKSVFLNDFE